MNFDPDWGQFQQRLDQVKIGEFDGATEIGGRSRLDKLLETVRLPYENYLIYCEGTKVSSKKPSTPKEVFLFICTEGIITLRTDKQRKIDKMGKISRYAYI